MKKPALTYLNCAITLMLALVPFNGWSGEKPGYDIRIRISGCNDTMAYLVKYRFDHKVIADTCKIIKDGLIQFRGEKELDKGVYALLSESKAIYFDFLINENQDFSIHTDIADVISKLKVKGNNENELFFSYLKFMTENNREINASVAEAK